MEKGRARAGGLAEVRRFAREPFHKFYFVAAVVSQICPKICKVYKSAGSDPCIVDFGRHVP